MRVSEPTTAATDYILAVELLLLGSVLAGSSSQLSVSLWAVSFLVMGVASMAGGTFHAGRAAFDPPVLRALWNSVQIGMTLSFGIMLAAGAVSTSGAPRWILLSASVLVLVMSHREFTPPPARRWSMAMKIAAILLPALAVVSLIRLLDDRSPAGMWIVAGGLITAGGIAAQRAGVTIHRWFNYNDLFHVMMMAAYYFLYRGGLLLRDR